jgi:GMP synthase (glutamine-hydrolysing)
MPKLRYLLLQTRNVDDPMREQEVRCFARALSCERSAIDALDLLDAAPTPQRLRWADVILLGGSGHYSAAGEGAWLDRALDSLRMVYESRLPTFASCWGFQAMARALGGEVVHDLDRAELGTQVLSLTEDGLKDPIFGPLGTNFFGQMGHEDVVTQLPPGAVWLARSERVQNQAYCFLDRPLYCTQFHPELNCGDLLERVVHYPEYIRKIAGMEPDQFAQMIHETPETEALLKRFVQKFVLGCRA